MSHVETEVRGKLEVSFSIKREIRIKIKFSYEER